MRVHVLGCAGGSAPRRELTSYLLDGRVAVDAGSLTTALDLDAQQRLQAVLLSHGHQDHIWSLPLLLANRFNDATPTCAIYGSTYTLDTVREHQMNDRVWPDFTRASTGSGPLLGLSPLEPGDTVVVQDRYRITAVPLDHTVPCQGHLVECDEGAILLGADTHVTDRLWTVANRTKRLRALIVECSFPDEFGDLALRSRHLTPALLGQELRKLKVDVPVHVTHMKPGYEARILDELEGLGDTRVTPLRQGQVLDIA